MVKRLNCLAQNNMNNLRQISIAEVEYIAHNLAKELLKWDEPIPNFGTRFPHRLESCLAVPFFTFSKKPLYHGLVGKASALFYAMIKNHPFQNGNKRIAMTTMLVFLYKNNKWLKVDNQQLYNFSKTIAQSDPVIKEEMVKAIEKFLVTYLVKIQ